MTDSLDCKTVSRMISDGQDKTLDPRERAKLRYHFVLCQTCRDVDEQVRFLRQAMQRLGKDELPQH
jgi:hypothetical protein